jgi:uncharacterized protein
MAAKVFIDTWGWIVLRNKREPAHAEIEEWYRNFRQSGKGPVYTSDYVLDETYTLLFRHLPFAQARESVKYLDDAINQGYLILESVNLKRFDAAKSYRLKFDDKPKISFTDFTSMAIMRDLGISEVLTNDDHFLQVGMGFKLIP